MSENGSGSWYHKLPTDCKMPEFVVCLGSTSHSRVTLHQLRSYPQKYEPQSVKTNASPSQTKSRNRQSKFVVRTIVRPRFCAVIFFLFARSLFFLAKIRHNYLFAPAFTQYLVAICGPINLLAMSIRQRSW